MAVSARDNGRNKIERRIRVEGNTEIAARVVSVFLFYLDKGVVLW